MGRWQSFKELIFGKREEKSSLAASIIAAPGSGGVIWTPRGYENFSKETYLKNVTAFRSIDEIATNVSSVPWKEFRRIDEDKREVSTDTAIAEVLKRPNPNESLEFVMLSATAYLVMSGNSFFERVVLEGGPNAGNIKELYTLRPDRFKLKINPSTGQLEKYIYMVQGRPVEWQVNPITQQADILHLKSFHPMDDWWGAAPTESAAREIDTSNVATQWNMNLLSNQCRPGMIYTLVGATGEAFMDQLEKYLREEKSGASNVGKDMIITGERGTKAEPYGWSPTDMDFSEGDLRLMRKIAMAYRVPPMILGIPGEATFANFKEARLAFWESTILYYLNYIRGELNNWFYDEESDRFVDYVLDDVPALAVKRDQIWERAQNSDFLTIDEKREMVGRDKYEPTEEPGSVLFIEASKIPIESAAEAEVEEEEVEEEEEGVDEEEEEVRKDLEKQGYTDDEIDEFLGYKQGEDFNPEEEKPYPNEHACRLKEPGQFDRFARVNCYKKSDGKCVDYIFGIKDNKSQVQALRYRKKIWNAASARKHCASRGGRFEAAG